jgi:hypothetical protein
MSYFFLKHCMNKLSGLSCPKSIPSFFDSIEADDNAASKLEVASFNFFLNFAISLSFLRNFSAKSCYVSKRFCHAYCLTYRIPSKHVTNIKWFVYCYISSEIPRLEQDFAYIYVYTYIYLYPKSIVLFWLHYVFTYSDYICFF